MADVRPFCALRPRNDLADQIIAPPYDVLTEDEARALAQNPSSFVHITRSEVDLARGADPHSAEAYARARFNLTDFIERGLLTQDSEPTYYLYGQTMGEHSQVGILAATSVDEYDSGQIKKHEYPRPDKEDDRTHHMEVLDAQVGLVFLTYDASSEIDQLTAAITTRSPEWSVTTEDGVQHALWLAPADSVPKIRAAFSHVPALYIADGHHRSAAAARVHASRQTEQSAFFLAGLFPANQLQVMAYNRVVHDLNGLSPEEFLSAVQARFHLSSASSPYPNQRGHIHMFFRNAWHRLEPHTDRLDPTDPVNTLDVALLQNHLLQPLLGIDDPRRSKRIHFVGGIRGHSALEDAVRSGSAVAFCLFPTGLDQLFTVANADQVMPPKSTWFEPKLREGVVVRLLNDTKP